MSSASLWGGSTIQRVRLVTGLVLFAFAATHFINHALGLVSLEAMNAFDGWRLAVTRSRPGSLVLLAALLGHAGVGLWTTLRRKAWALPAWQWVQILSGIAIPLLLVPHMVGTTVASLAFDVRPTYAYVLARVWTATIGQQGVLLLLVWVHGCIGLHYWLRLARGYRAVQPVLFALAVLVPFAALAGVSVQGRAIAAAMADPARAAAMRAETAWPDPAEAGQLADWQLRARLAYGALLLALGSAAVAGALAIRRRRRIPVQYLGGPLVRAEPGLTLLDVSRRHNVPHVAVCGGRGRCSTCRVMVLDNGRGLSPMGEDESRTLAAIGAPPQVRLACQAVATGSVTVLPLLKAAAGASAARGADHASAGDGVERDLAVLFVDLRGFTALTERKLPFDVIYILNQFFSAVGGPVHEHGGWIANYAGDGVIALFGNEEGLDAACRSALLAAAAIDLAVRRLGAQLREEIRAPLRIAMGLHAGPHVMGRVGFGDTRPTTVVGLAVNVASRLESLAKQHGVQLALSRTVANHGGLDTEGWRSEPVVVRGVSEPLPVVLVPAAAVLIERLDNRGVLRQMALH